VCFVVVRVFVEDDLPASVPQQAVVLVVQETSIVFRMPASQGRKRVFVGVDGQASNKRMFTYSPPVISSMTPSELPTAGLANVVLTGDSFGSCAGVSGCHLQATVVFPPYSISVDNSDQVCSAAQYWLMLTIGTHYFHDLLCSLSVCTAVL
jgi:hypothetical protein